MPGASTARFVIRTASGDKGPFTSEQIASFVAGGKLPGTAKIFDTELQRPVTAAEAGAPVEAAAAEAAPDEFPETAAPGRVDTDAATPGAPGVAAASPSTRRARKGTGRVTATDQRRGRTGTHERGGPRKRKKSRTGLIVVLAIVAVAVIAGVVVLLQSMKKDQFAGQADALLAQTLAHPEALAAGAADAAFVRILAKRDHADALAAAKNQRGTYDGGKPAYDEAKYREALRAAIAKQVAGADSALLTACAKELATASDPSVSDVATAKKLAQQAVTMDGEKNYLSLDALGWATFRAGDAKRAALIEEQASALAPDTASKTECEKALRKFRSGKQGPDQGGD